VGRTGTVIRCVECGAESDQFETGWRAYIAGELDDEEREDEVLMFCPHCAQGEFGPFDAGLDA
jgi:hypothetical protein